MRVDLHLAHVLRTLRTKAGLTQEEVADRTGLSARAIGDLERGAVRRPHRKTIELLADAFKLDEQDARLLAEAARPPLRPPRAEDAREAGAYESGTDADPSAARGQPPPVQAQPPSPSPPRQLPGSTRHFSGRADELMLLDRLLERQAKTGHAARIAAITGTAGIGKTALALHWAHATAAAFPEGQFFLNLRGFDPTGDPLTPGHAIRSLLEALGVPASGIPTSLEAQTGLYRSLVADKRLLIVLDNARDINQVQPLLPGSPSCVVLITSRNQLIGLLALHDAQPVTLEAPSAEEALELLTRRIAANHARPEPTAELHELVELCARLPLALSVAAACLALNPQPRVPALVARLRDTRLALAALDGGDSATDVRAVFSWSFHQLDETAARLFRLLSVHPGPDIALPAAASVAGIPAERARTALDTLTRAHLLTESAAGRFSTHDLLRAYSIELAGAHDSEAQRREATLRMLDYYLHTSMRAMRVINPTRERLAVPEATAGVRLDDLPDLRAALDWYASERPALPTVIARAGAQGFPSHAYQTAWATTGYFNQGAYWDEWLATQWVALAAAQTLGDVEGEASAHRNIGVAHFGRDEEAQTDFHLGRALDLQIQHGYSHGEAKTHEALAIVHERRGEYRQSLEHSLRAAELYRRVGYRPGLVLALNLVGWYHSLLGDFPEALTFCLEALELSEELGSRYGQGNLWDSLGHIHHNLGNHAQAVACYERALALFREFDERLHLAGTLDRLGDAHLTAGALGAAHASWRQALAVLEELGRPEADAVRKKLPGSGADAR